ncbi:hypothetical protein BH11MYX3_BH11MYX3_46690 [soil metagenome]
MSFRLVTVLIGLLGATAAAAPDRRVTVDVPPAVAPASGVSHTIVMERCTGNCNLAKSSTNNAMMTLSTIPQGAGPFTVQEFKNSAGLSGAAADAEWNALVTCVREVYSPFDVIVTDERPTSGSTYHLSIVAGLPAQVGLPADILGIAPLAGDCSPQDNVISFSFANAHPSGMRVMNLCWTVSQESAHAFGLDHEFMFFDGKSTCIDPMTYRNDCGGQHFFRDKGAQCGEFTGRACKCSANQNSHQKLLSLFGPGQILTAPPTSSITFPQPTATVLGAVVGARAGSQRGVAKVELVVNGFVWATVGGITPGPSGQPNPSDYSINVPANLPKSIVDIVVRASDDLGTFTDSPKITLTNGAPCTDASACAEFQSCEDGRCLWAPRVGELGDECKYTQFCKSNLCVDTSVGKLCSQACTPDSDSCPMDLTCAEASPGNGLCVPVDDGGCCDSGRSSDLPWTHAGFAALVIGLVGRRRRSSSRMVGGCQHATPRA